jgi:ribokinase
MRVGVVGHVEWVEFISVSRLPRPGEIVHAEGTFARAAGGGGVVAVVLAELGAEVDFFCALGRDAIGRAAVKQLSERGVKVHVGWRGGPTRRAVTMLEGGGERTIVTVGERLHPLGADKLAWGRLGRADAVYFTAGDYGALALARRARMLVVSPRAREALREGGWDGERSTRVGRQQGDNAPIDAVVFSARDHDESEWARTISARARLLVATDGTNGGRWWGTSQGQWKASRPPGRRRDSYGCGDSFAAGFTFGLAAGRSVAQAAAAGARSGARCLTRVGAP